MKSTVILGCLGLLLALASGPAAAQDAAGTESHVTTLPEPQPVALTPPRAHPFAAMAGTWTGGGMIDLTNDIHERLRCRATYNYGQSNNSLALAIRCASDNYKFELSSNVVERNGHISGSWKEAAYNVSGQISGRVNGGRISATAKGDSFNASLSVNTNGNHMSVTITPQATYVTNVHVALSRAATAR